MALLFILFFCVSISFLTSFHVCRRIPRAVLETVYGINLVPPQEGEDPDREPYAEELLNAYGCESST